jgi:hypothetical protein
MDGERQIETMRVEPRYGCAGDAEIVVPGRGLRYAGRIGDLSLRGCFIEVVCRLERGTAVEVWMNARGQPLRVAANLMVQNSSGVGLRFLGVPARKEEQIQSLIAELAEEAAARRAAEAVPGADAAGPEGMPDGMHLVEPLQQGGDGERRGAGAGTGTGTGVGTGVRAGTGVEAARGGAAGHSWQRWRRQLGAWLSR